MRRHGRGRLNGIVPAFSYSQIMMIPIILVIFTKECCHEPRHHKCTYKLIHDSQRGNHLGPRMEAEMEIWQSREETNTNERRDVARHISFHPRLRLP